MNKKYELIKSDKMGFFRPRALFDFKKIKEWWAARVYARQLKKAIKEANRIKQTTRMKCLVVDINGRPMAVTKRELKGFIKAGYIPKNTNLEWVEKNALYNTL